MQLSDIERLILANQFRILEGLASNDELKKNYRDKQIIVERGYIMEYEQLICTLQDNNMSETDYKEVREILTMFNDIQWSYDNLTDKTGVDANQITFKGFDMHTEAEQCEYAKFFLKGSQVSPDFLRKMSSDMNSHQPMLHEYKKMLGGWKGIPDRKPKNLSATQINSLLKQ